MTTSVRCVHDLYDRNLEKTADYVLVYKHIKEIAITLDFPHTAMGVNASCNVTTCCS